MFEINLKKFAGVVLLWGALGFQSQAFSQAGLRESLERLDRNENGYLDPDEVTTLSRPYLERILGNRYGRRRSVDFDDPIPISRIQESARYYYAMKNGVSGFDVRPEGEDGIKEFELGWEDPIVPDFGVAKLRFPYTKADLNEADNTIRRCDSNRDGFVDRREASRNRWTHRDPFADDLNKDGKLSRLELAQRYARRRNVSEDAGELWKKSRRTGGEVKSSVRSSRERYYAEYQRSRDVSKRLAADLVSRFDSNRDRALDEKESQGVGIPFVKLDLNNDGTASRAEIEEVMSFLQAEASESQEGIPDWFIEKDKNKDNQIEMTEFTDEEWTKAKLKEFEGYDLNSDGLITTKEIIAAGSQGGQYVSKDAEVLAPKKSVISEIEITDDFKISNLKLKLSLTHTYISQLDGYLTGPDGQRIELFTAIGGSDDNFEGAVFDDASSVPITKSRAPFRGTYRPEALDRKQPGLSHFKGKSAKGVWQLIISGKRNTRFGMLHGWELIVEQDE